MRALRFDNAFVRDLPADPVTEPRRRQVHGALYSHVQPTPVAAPRVIAHSREMAATLGFSEADIEAPEFAQVFGGNAVAEGMQPYAANYGGHQFGNWAGQLGDGRAITLGEIVNAAGERWELQLKGAGPTPYSRTADGRAVLRSSVREFLCSEAMHHLGVPTTRALCLVATGEQVERDMFYDGRPKMEPGAIVCRVAPSFIRFGNFELCTSREDVPLLRKLVDFTLEHYFPQLDSVAQLLVEVAERTARLMAQWQAVGFVHGVMNTDNMSMLGLTIDYGPYGWVDDFDPSWTPNTTDAEQRRYRYGNQPRIGLWNLERLGVALLPLLADDESLVENALVAYQKTFEAEAARRNTAKLGLSPQEHTIELTWALFSFLSEQETDMTIFYRGLGEVVKGASPTVFPEVLKEAFYKPAPEAHLRAGLEWLQKWWLRTREEAAAPQVVAERMNAVNPKYVLRNYLAQEAIDAAHAGDPSGITTLLEVLRHPFSEQPGQEKFAQKRPEWARSKPGCSALSCSS